MKNDNMPSVQELFQQMSTEELRALLDKELHTEPVNDHGIRLIMGVLRERNKDTAVQVSPETLKAWEKYRKATDQIYAPARRNLQIRRWLTRAAAAAAVLALLLLPVIPQEAGAESFWETLTRWTSEVMEFFGYRDNEDRLVAYEFRTDNPGLQEVYDKVIELGITVPVVPMWLPEGYELVECQVVEYPVSTKLHSRFVNTEETIIFSIEVFEAEVSRKYQKDETAVDTIESAGILHQQFSNLDTNVIIWTRENIECSLFVSSHEASLDRIIKSIYDSEAN